MRLTRVHVPGPLFAGKLVLPEGPARHLVRVLRLDAGAVIRVFDGEGHEFEAVIDQITINGVDIVTWNSEHKIVEFKVMVRPLQAINLLHQKMAAMLESMK